MLAGRIAITFNGFSIKAQAITDFPTLAPEIGTTVYPEGPVLRECYPFTLSYAIRKSTRFPKEAASVISYLFDPADYSKVLDYTQGATGVSLMGFANLEIWDKPDFGTNLEAIKYAHLFAPPSSATAQVYNDYVIIDMVA